MEIPHSAWLELWGYGQKREHEARVERLTGINPERASHPIYYQAPIGDHRVLCDTGDCFDAMFSCDRFPTRDTPIDLSMASEAKDSQARYWEQERQNLKSRFERLVQIDLEMHPVRHFSIFAIAPQPLLIYLGSLFTDKYQASTFQLRRKPATWSWPELRSTNNFHLDVSEPTQRSNTPVLTISLSAKIDRDRVHSVLGDNVSIWEISHPNPNSNCIGDVEHLHQFMESARSTIHSIAQSYGNRPLHVFPVMPVSCAVELGRIRMPKADMPWRIYDQHNAKEGFDLALTI